MILSVLLFLTSAVTQICKADLHPALGPRLCCLNLPLIYSEAIMKILAAIL